MIRIAQASSSEDFTKYGIAPNQRRTGATASNPGGNMDGELNIIHFKEPWEVVYRPIDDEVAEKIATFFYRAVMNGSHIGYSWRGNTQLYDAMEAKRTDDPMDVDTPVNTDCCALAGVAVKHAGINAPGLRAMTTWKMDEVLMATGAFIKITTKEMVQQGVGLKRGDLVWRTGHTACVLDSDNTTMFYYQKITFKDVAISAGTPGTRALQRTQAVTKEGYRPLLARLHYVSNSALCNVVPFFGWGDETRLSVNFYRASGASGKIDATIVVIWVRNEVTT